VKYTFPSPVGHMADENGNTANAYTVELVKKRKFHVPANDESARFVVYTMTLG
jgi:hypothetical protein